MVDNIIIKKKWTDESLIEIEVIALSEFIKVKQFCYIQDSDLKKNGEKIADYSTNSDKSCYVEFGNKQGKFTPAFSLEILPADIRGHVKIEVDIEINDNQERKHRSVFYIKSALGSVEAFGRKIKLLVLKDDGHQISLSNL